MTGAPSLPPAPVPGAGRATIAALGVVQILAWGSSYYLLAVLAPAIAADTGWPLQGIMGSLSLGLLVAALVAPRVGALIGARGGRPALTAGCGLLALGLALLGLAPNLAVFALGWCVVGAGMAASLYDAAFATLSRIHGAAARRAITALTLWGGFASTVCWPISAFLEAHLGWRGTCLAYAAIHLGLCMPLLVRALPAPLPKPAPRAQREADRAVVLVGAERTRFLLLAGIITATGTITAIISVQLLMLLQAQGVTLAAAVAAGTLIGPAQVFARLIERASGGRHHPLWTMTGAVALMGAGVGLLAAGFPVVAVALVAYGAGNGIFSIAKGTAPLALLGADRYPVLSGRLARPALLAQALSPSVAAYLLAAGGAEAVFAALVGLAVMAAILLALLWRLR